MVSITLRVLSRPDTDHLSKIYQSLGLDYDERVLPSIGNEVLKAIVAQFDAAELITQREVVSSRIRADLLQRAGEFNIKLEDVSITHLTFGKVGPLEWDRDVKTNVRLLGVYTGLWSVTKVGDDLNVGNLIGRRGQTNSTTRYGRRNVRG